MQYVRSLSGAVSTTWNSINPATLSGAIDVIVVEQEDGSLACSPFHIRFGKFSLLRPSDKKVEFKVNGEKVDLPMKLGEGGEAFFVFETQGQVPENLQTSPLVSPETSPDLRPSAVNTPALQEPDPFDLENQNNTALGRRPHSKSTSEGIQILGSERKAQSDVGHLTPLSSSPNPIPEPLPTPKLERTATESDLAAVRASLENAERPIMDRKGSVHQHRTERAASNPPPASEEAVSRAMNLSKKLWTSNISNQVTETGDLMLDMTGFKSSDGEALQAEVIARQLLSEEIDGPYDIGALIGADERGNIWIYSSEEAKEAANRKVARSLETYDPTTYASTEALSDPGYHSDDSRSDTRVEIAASHARHDSDSALGMASQPSSPSISAPPARGDPNKNYAKTLRLTTDQLRQIGLNPGANAMSFTVNRATCTATLWYWRYDVPIVISDIDGTITKSDVLGHVLNTFGRDWTHSGVAKLYTEIAANGYNFLYLTSRSVGQADTTRAYLNGVVQEGYRLPKGPTILSPDRLIAALRREVYLRKPEIFKMACLRDIMALFAGHGGTNNPTESVEAGLHSDVAADVQALSAAKVKGGSPFYAGFGNRLTDALSYRSVNIPSTRIFTINSNSEVSLDLLSLNKYKTAYSTMREIVDHYFPPVGLLVQGGGEEYTDFNYWRERPLDIVDFTDSESEDEDYALRNALRRTGTNATRESILSEDEAADDMIASYMTDPRGSLDESIAESAADEEELTSSMLDEDEEPYYDDDEDVDVNDERLDQEETDGIGAPRTPEPEDRRPGSSSNLDATPTQKRDSLSVRLNRLGVTGESDLSDSD